MRPLRTTGRICSTRSPTRGVHQALIDGSRRPCRKWPANHAAAALAVLVRLDHQRSRRRQWINRDRISGHVRPEAIHRRLRNIEALPVERARGQAPPGRLGEPGARVPGHVQTGVRRLERQAGPQSPHHIGDGRIRLGAHRVEVECRGVRADRLVLSGGEARGPEPAPWATHADPAAPRIGDGLEGHARIISHRGGRLAFCVSPVPRTAAAGMDRRRRGRRRQRALRYVGEMLGERLRRGDLGRAARHQRLVRNRRRFSAPAWSRSATS